MKRITMRLLSLAAAVIPVSVALLIGLLMAMSGCGGTKPANFYVLTPLADASAIAPAPGMNDLTVGIGPLRMPDYLQRPQMVTSGGGSEVTVDEFHRWAGSVYEDFLRVLTMNLSALLPSSLVVAFLQSGGTRI